MVALSGAAQTNFTNLYNNGAQLISSNAVLQNSDGLFLMAGRADTVINAIQGPAGFIKKNRCCRQSVNDGLLRNTQYDRPGIQKDHQNNG